MNPFNPYEKYKENNIMTASPGEMVVMLFEGCVKFLKLGRMAIEEKDIENANNNLKKAQNIVMELIQSLNFEYEISHNLFKHYEYIYREIIQCNIHKDAERLEPIIKVMDEYAETWKEAVKIDRKNKHDGDDGSYA